MKVVCGVCVRKPSDVRTINDVDLERILKFHYADYNIAVMPTVVCSSCRKALRFIDTHGKNAGYSLPEPEYDKLRLPATTTTRQQATCCDCSFCQVGRMNGIEYKKYCSAKRAGKGRPVAEDRADPPTPIGQTICSLCKGIQIFILCDTLTRFFVRSTPIPPLYWKFNIFYGFQSQKRL